MADALTDYLDAAIEAACRGADALESWRGRFQVNEKGRADLVTDADLAAQQAVRSVLQARFPGHAFLEEEGGGDKDRPAADGPPTWIVDPLDGTTNYVHDLPLYCVSIGLWERGELAVGVVLDPRHQELFSAARGRGAWLNGTRRLQVSRTQRLEDALLATGFPPDLRGQERTLDWWRHFSFRTRSLRRTGSTALNLAYLAAGRFDGYWAFDNHAWDVAGGVVLVREAGGVVTNIDGAPFDPFTPDGLASNGPLHPALLATLRQGPSPEAPP
jgi:myo-inositol-1(or 4)-monophosphatase